MLEPGHNETCCVGLRSSSAPFLDVFLCCHEPAPSFDLLLYPFLFLCRLQLSLDFFVFVNKCSSLDKLPFYGMGILKVSINIFLRTSVQKYVAAAFVPESQIHMAGKRGCSGSTFLCSLSGKYLETVVLSHAPRCSFPVSRISARSLCQVSPCWPPLDMQNWG